MVPVRMLSLFLGFQLMLLMLIVAVANALQCTKLKLAGGNKLYPNCTDLPSLGAFLHWTHNASTNTLSIAYTATPHKPGGWISWAINPTGTGMVGAQSLISFPLSNGSVAVGTYNISSYRSIQPSKLSFDVKDLSAVSDKGKMTIFATITLPDGMSTINQVWQVGGDVSDGVPQKHDFAPANLNAKGPLKLVTSTSGGAGSPAPAPSPSTAGGGNNTNSESGGDMITGMNKIGFGILFSLLLVNVIGL